MLGTCRALALVEGLALDVEEEVMVLLNQVLLVLLEASHVSYSFVVFTKCNGSELRNLFCALYQLS